MGALDGRVAIITGAGRGLGREHALLFASEGAKVVVNDLGGDIDGTGDDRAPAQQVVDEIKAMGGEAVANVDNVADWEGAQRLIQTAVDTFGTLHVLVNNAGILRDRVIVNMTEQEWDSVIHVHLKGHFCPTRFAAAYWREQSKAGNAVKASIIHTSSTSGLLGNPGQANYGAAKSGIATFSQICAMELEPLRRAVQRDRPGGAHPADRADARPERGREGARERADTFDAWDPANVSPFVAYLATEDCTFSGSRRSSCRVAWCSGSRPWTLSEKIDKGDRWTVAELADEAGKLDSGPTNPVGATDLAGQ